MAGRRTEVLDGWTRGERRVLASLRRPMDVQRFLDALPYNLEPDGETSRSPRAVLRDRVAHCLEGGFLAASAFRFHGRPPLVMQLRAVRDEDHLLALYRENGDTGAWGAVAKSKFAGIRFREPVYRTLRELAMSYFEGYFNYAGEKTLRARSGPVNLSRFDARGWERSEVGLDDVAEWMALRRMTPLVTPEQTIRRRMVDPISFAAGPIAGLRLRSRR